MKTEREKLQEMLNHYYELIDKLMFDRNNLTKADFDYINNFTAFINIIKIDEFVEDIKVMSKNE